MNATFEECLKSVELLEDRHGAIRTLYSTGHTYATFQILNGVDCHTLAKNMGTSIGMLEKHYSQPNTNPCGKRTGRETTYRQSIVKQT
jgi:integrase